MPGVVAAVVAAAAAGGYAAASAGLPGVPAACGNAARVSAVQVRRSPGWAPLPPARPGAAPVRRLFRDLCAAAAHPDDPQAGAGSCACPASPVPLYRGIFYAGHRRLAIFAYDSGFLWLYAGPAQQVQAAISGPADTRLGAALAAVLGISPASVYDPGRRPQPPAPPPRLTVAAIVVVTRSGAVAVVSGTARCGAGEHAMLRVSLDQVSASGRAGGTAVPIGCDGRRHRWSAPVRVSGAAQPGGTRWTAPGSGDVVLFADDPGGPLDFHAGALAGPVTREVRFAAPGQASR